MNSIFKATGDGWSLEVVGKLPTMPPVISRSVKTKTEIASLRPVTIEIINMVTEKLEVLPLNSEHSPLFFESCNYDIYLESSSDLDLMLPAGAIAKRIKPTSKHYSINFGNNLGFFEATICNSSINVKLRFEVFSRKIDYKSDYIVMRDDISSILRNLAMTTNAKTFGLSSPASCLNPTLTEWFAIISQYFDEFINIANSIAKKPHSTLKKIDKNKEADKARKIDRNALKIATQRSKPTSYHHSNNLPIPRVIPERTASLTFDTYINRYFKGILEITSKNVRTLLNIKEAEDEDADFKSEKKFYDQIRPSLKRMSKRIDSVMRTPFIKSIGSSTLTRPTSMVLQKHPVYSKFDKLARVLNGGLSFTGQIIPIEVKDTALLYEYWCFLTIVNILCSKFNVANQSIIKVNKFKTTVTLKKGIESLIKFTDRQTNQTIYVFYNKLFTRLPTIPQKPDNVIQIANERGFYILDAKYKFQFDDDYIKRYGGLGPTLEDINTMHRYRDAIVIPHPLNPEKYDRGCVVGAAILFPYTDESAYIKHKFYKSLESVEIGGIPCLPSATGILQQKLEKIISVGLQES